MSDTAKTSGALLERFEAPVLGVPMVVRANSVEVVAAAERAFGRWRGLPAALIEAGPPGQVEVIVQALAPGELALGGNLVTRHHAGALIAAGGGCLLSALPASGQALAFIAPEVAADEPRLRHEVLERLTLTLAGARGRAPLRAGAVVWHGRGLLFIGAGEALAVMLAVGCARAGAALLAAGVVYLSAGRVPLLWGHPGMVRLPSATARLFPELPWRPMSGEATLIELDAAALGPERLATHAARATLCLVEPGAGQASHLERLARDEALALVVRLLELDHAVAAPLASLASEDAYRIRVGADARAAVALIGHLAEREGLGKPGFPMPAGGA
ncbi:MAG: hypothetical protein N2378_07615 [Chloroflexaceae bacterium]|nr:hypothetical protein [Chloroflexaceae bacterium]